MSVPDVLPPSPPTTNHRGRSSLPMPFNSIMSTPDDSPASFPPSSGTGTRKRVEFSPWPNVVGPISSTPSSEMMGLKALPPSRDCQRNNKTILKPFAEPVVSVSSSRGPNEGYPATAEMLESIAQQLANNNKGSSLDAYQILSQVIKAYDEIPEDVNTRICIANILRCIKRDLSIQDHVQSSPIDTNLMTQALKVSVILVWSEHISPLLTDEFRVFIIDRSINVLAEHTAPKVIIIHYMHLLAMQNFRSSIMASNNRASKLLEALQEITNHVQGKGAVSERLLIYQKLIDQAKSVMKARASLWIKEILVGLSSSVKDLRDKAISVCTRACAAYPSSPTMSAAAREALASTITDRAGNTRSLSLVITQRLEKMVAAKDEAIQVPQIWALCILLCNSIDSRMEGWSLLKDWLKVIQRCFNCSDNTVRSQAFPAWNRFIYISKPHEASDNIVSMLAKPITAQIERTSNNSMGRGLRPAAVSSYCMLLYHAFRPAASHKQHTRMWNEYIVKMMGSQFLSKSTANADLCSRILMSMMWKEHSASRVWNENRAHENTLLEPEELPTIDPKWIRSKTDAILQIFKLLFKHSAWGPAVQHSDQAYIAKAWRHFLRAIRESASKEIKPSAETRKALLHIVKFLRDAPESDRSIPKSSLMESKTQLASSIAIAELGPLCFLELLENDTDLRSPIVLGELLKAITDTSATQQRLLQQSNAHPSVTSLPHNLRRCFRMLDDSLQKLYDRFDQQPSFLKPCLIAATRAVKSLTPDLLLSGLVALQSSLAVVIKDEKNLAKLGSESATLVSAWMELSDTVINKIMTIALSEYQQIDDILAAALLSFNLFTKNRILTSWDESKWSACDVSYGPKLLGAIYLTQEQLEINLPGIRNVSEEPQTQIQRDVQMDSCIEDTYVEGEIERQVISDAYNKQEKGPEQQVDQSEDEDTPKATKFVRTKPNHEQNRPRHNNSQIHFVSIDSSPKAIDVIESQFLTSRQKDVRERQRAEQIVTFPDLRSSPRPLSVRGSRATSVDCEMARKVAAMDDLPSTPTISRQNEAVDEDELPSPTPRARHKKLDLTDVDIPSSPPSAMGNRKSNIEVQDIPSSPPKANNDEEADMVDLGETDLTREDVSRDLGQVVERVDGGMVTDDILAQNTIVIPIVGNPSIDHPAAESADHETTLGSTVLETAQDITVQHPTLEESLQEQMLVADEDVNVGTDEIDDLSASQLSQSLDMHIAEEAIYTTTFTMSNMAAEKPQKRRKRATSGYADQDRKRRRRVASQTETNMSSFASDEFVDTMEGPPDLEKCIVVSTSPSIKPARHRGRAATEEDIDSSSEVASTGSRRRLRSNRTSHLPAHVKSRSPEGMKVSKDLSQSAGPREEIVAAQSSESSAYTSVDDKSVTEHIASVTEEDVLITGNKSPSEIDFVRDETSLFARRQGRVLSTTEFEVMNALQTALNGLNKINRDERASIDLKAIDDLCFKIRYQAQEIMQAGKQH